MRTRPGARKHEVTQPLVTYIFFNRKIVAGMTSGADKG